MVNIQQQYPISNFIPKKNTRATVNIISDY